MIRRDTRKRTTVQHFRRLFFALRLIFEMIDSRAGSALLRAISGLLLILRASFD